jgi:hypothetical protein
MWLLQLLPHWLAEEKYWWYSLWKINEQGGEDTHLVRMTGNSYQVTRVSQPVLPLSVFSLEVNTIQSKSIKDFATNFDH